jgi:replicative DNA helicase
MQPTLHPACVKCIAAQKKRYPSDYNRLRCSGIKLDVLEGIDTTEMSPEEQESLRTWLDPWAWGIKEFAINPREYQEEMTKCSAIRKVFRLGRRAGKTQTLVLLALHKMFTTRDLRVLLFTPYESQIELFFTRILEWMDKSPTLSQSVKRVVKDPFTLEFHNGSVLIGFTTGVKAGQKAGSSRGQEADIIILDEADLLSKDDMTTILPMLQRTDENSTEEKELWVASTPTGKHDFFYDWANSPNFKEFHFTSLDNPAWNDEMEAELRQILPNKSDWEHEILAEWGEETEGVYQHGFIDRALTLATKYFPGHGIWDYEKSIPDHGCLYIIGVDWNKASNGVQIVVVEANPMLLDENDVEKGVKARFRIVTRVNVDSVEFTQHKAIGTIIQLNRIWNPAYIYVDEGYGETQIEALQRYGNEHKDSNILHKLKPINFSSMHEIRNPVSKMLEKKHMKPFIVNNSVSFFENNLVILNKSDREFEKQLRDYTVEKRSRDGRPVYSEGNDHILDAFNLAMLGYTMEYTDLGRAMYVNNMKIVGNLGQKKADQFTDEDGTMKFVDNSKKNRPIVQPRQIMYNDRDQARQQRAWRTNQYKSNKFNRPIKRTI